MEPSKIFDFHAQSVQNKFPVYQNIPYNLKNSKSPPLSLTSSNHFSASKTHYSLASPAAVDAASTSQPSESSSPDTSTAVVSDQCVDQLQGKQQQAPPMASSSLSALITEANNAYAVGDMATALRAYRHVLRAEPRNHVLHANISAILLRMDAAEDDEDGGADSTRRKEEALEAAEKAIQMKPDWSKAHFRRGEALSALGRGDEAVLAHAEAFRLSAGRDEQFRTALISRCIQLNNSTSRRSMSEIFAKEFAKLQLNDHGADGCALVNTIAKCFQIAKKPELARSFNQISAKMEPSNVTVKKLDQKQLVLVKTEANDDDNFSDELKAVEHKLEIAELKGDEMAQMSVHGQMAKLLSTNFLKFDLSIHHFTEQLRLAKKFSVNPKNAFLIRLELANLHLKMRNAEQAKQIFKQLLEEQPSDPDALFGLGQAFYLTNELQSALTMFNRVEKLAPSNSLSNENIDENLSWHNAIVGKCHCYLARGDTEKAIDLAENVLKNAKNLDTTKFYLVMALGLMRRGKLPAAMRWAKRLLTAQINAKSGGNMVDVLYTVMILYEKMGQRENAEKVADQLINQLEKCQCQPNPFGPSPDEILDQICQIQRQSGFHEQIGRAMKLRMKLVPNFSNEWAKIAMEMAKMDFEREHLDITNCADLVQRLDQWTEQQLGPVEMELNPDPARVQWEVDLLTVRAELAWRKQQQTMNNNDNPPTRKQENCNHKNGEEENDADDDDCHPFTLLETALMLAQESALTDAEADICLRLGEWHLAKGGDEEAVVYLRQVIALGRQILPANQRRLLRAYSALIKVLCTQCQWEDAFCAARCKLGIQKCMGMPMVDRLRTQLKMGQILLETTTTTSATTSKRSDRYQNSSSEEEDDFVGTVPEGPITAMQIFQRIRRRAKCLNATEELKLAEECLAQCRNFLKSENQCQINPSNGIEHVHINTTKLPHMRSASEMPFSHEQQKRGSKCRDQSKKRSSKGGGNQLLHHSSRESSSITAHFTEDTDTYCCIRGESRAESTASDTAPHVIGIDFDDD
ncbi:hypothetical protein niasHT_000918 [Heterodera trifolii]|uniref:Tetratricopeptide repeat protein n=1 Tax=Heterodera trifolii TaxID=157864 RepID=A0ABD2LR70_9BILA